MSTHAAIIRWSNTGPDFLKRCYSRAHTIHFDGGAVVHGSPSPHIVPAPWSDPSAVDPEEAFVASIASRGLPAPLICDYLSREASRNLYAEGTEFHIGRIGMSSHFIDCHHVQRVALNENEFVNEGRIWRMGYANQIPYRALTPKPAECTNLLVPGAASYTHVAFCTLRLESTWMITGHAAGVAATMVVKDEITVQKVNVAALQEKLRAQNQVIDFLPGQPEKCEHLNGQPEF